MIIITLFEKFIWNKGDIWKVNILYLISWTVWKGFTVNFLLFSVVLNLIENTKQKT